MDSDETVAFRTKYEAILADSGASTETKERLIHELVSTHIRDVLNTAPLNPKSKEYKELVAGRIAQVLASLGPDLPPSKVFQDSEDPDLWHFSYSFCGLRSGVVLASHDNTDFIGKHFPDALEYPDVCEICMKPGAWQTYVSSTFLNGWINYVRIKKVFLITRYRDHAANLAAVEACKNGRDVHTSLRVVGDDVLILAQEEGRSMWWVFWFDCDVSDCCIGRFESSETAEQLYADFEVWANAVSLDEGAAPALEVPVSSIHGWISF